MATATPALPDEATAGGRQLRTDSLAASMAMLLVLTVVQRLVGFLRGVLFCRWLDPEQLGQWDMAYGFLMLAAPLAVLGVPGSLGRYVEHYRQRGQLRAFLGRTVVWTVAVAAAAAVVLACGQSWFSNLVFGGPDDGGLMLLLALGLAVVILDNFSTSLYTALRQVKFVSAMQFTNSLVFAAIGIGLLLLWKTATTGVVLAWIGACLLTSTISLGWLARLWPALGTASHPPLPQRAMWAKLMPFAISLWVTNLLSNLFGIADRLLIIHYSGMSQSEALNTLGQYHTARIFPVLFLSIAELFSAMITPHLSCDWERGQRREVSRRLVLMVKVFGIGLLAISAAVLVGAPLLFDLVWRERYVGGLQVLPWALMYSAWAALASISYNYLWCAEKSRYVSLTVLVGLGINVALNLLLLPSLGLLGAVLAMAGARAAALGLLWWLVGRAGMKVDRGLVIVGALPLLLGLGPWLTLVVIAAVVLELVPGVRCFQPGEKEQLATQAREIWLKLKRWFDGDGVPSLTGRRSLS